MTFEGAQVRYGARADNPKAYAQLDHEVQVIEQLGFPGCFLVVRDIVRFCREANTLAQRRGPAANSAVCFALFFYQQVAGLHEIGPAPTAGHRRIPHLSPKRARHW
ncbi:hypothetical protein AB0878_06075 [Amycolatopsis sp. NPDC047767]|uniref:hypothetical protein n=1 Tax=Amycolatopsis sp. NPDC047767 TaxID=3156765 RepID=UPI003453F0B8